MPGTIIRERTQRLPRSLPTDTGVLFIAGPAEKGRSDEAHFIQNMADFERYVGSRVSTSYVYDIVDAFFQEGGSKVYFSRVFGPTPVTAGVWLLDGAAAQSIRVDASSPGAWGASLNVAVTAGDAGGEFKIVLTHDTDTTINETSPSFVDQAAAVEYFRTHRYIRLSVGASALDPAVVGTTSLTGGTDDISNATDATWLAALDRFIKSYGPGQVVYAGRTTSTAWGQLLNHADANNRFAIADPADLASKATLLTNSNTFKALTNAENGFLVGQWVNLPALAYGGSVRPIPGSGAVAALMARNDSTGHSPNEPAAGDNGILNYVTSLRTTFTDTEADELNAAGVNTFRPKAGDLKLYSYRTGADKTTKPLHWQAGNARLYMAIAAEADAILEGFVLKEIDGRGLLFKKLESSLASMLLGYFEQGSLYGATPQEAFIVDTASVNTAETIANGEIHAAIELTMSPMGETVYLDIVRRQVA